MEWGRVSFPFVIYFLKIIDVFIGGPFLIFIITEMGRMGVEVLKYREEWTLALIFVVFALLLILIILILATLEFFMVLKDSIVELAIYEEKIGYKLWPWSKEQQREYKEIISVKKYPEEKRGCSPKSFLLTCLPSSIIFPVIEITFEDKKRILIYYLFSNFEINLFLSYLKGKLNLKIQINN